jgi:DNA-binding transcriptional regulator YhcF (GntR family)
MRAATPAEHLADVLRNALDRRDIIPGESMPSIRTMARETLLATQTVFNAYQILVREGRIEARPGSRYRVCGASATTLEQRVANAIILGNAGAKGTSL